MAGTDLTSVQNFIFLSPPGEDAVDGARIERRVVDTLVRLGQKKVVLITRFCARETAEKQMWKEIDAAGVCVAGQEGSYVCEGWDKALPKRKRRRVEKAAVDTDMVTVINSVSMEESLRQKFEDAKKKGAIITLSDDEDDRTEVPKGSPQETPHSGSDDMFDKQPSVKIETPDPITQTKITTPSMVPKDFSASAITMASSKPKPINKQKRLFVFDE